MTQTRIREEKVATGPNYFVRLNTTWHERALWVYGAVVLLHWLEHLAQAYQIWILNMARPDSLGAIGAIFPWVVESETMHFGFAVFMLAGLVVLAPGFSGTAAKWWLVSFAIQSWHFVEHSLLQGQVGIGSNLFSADIPMSVVQLWIPRAELHLLYNLVVFIPMVVAMVLHARPPRTAGHDACSCAVTPVPKTASDAM
ncbi:MAG: hypothetical protein ACC654_12545 [Acidimicrobiia bacterium]